MGYFQYIILLNTRLLGRFAPIFNFVLFYRFFFSILTMHPLGLMCSAVLAFIDYKQTNKQTNRHPNKVLSLDIKWQKKKKFQTIIRGTLSERVEKAWKYIPMLQTCVKSGIGTGSLIFDPLVVSDTGWFLLGPGTRLLLPTEEGPATEKKKNIHIHIYTFIY